MSELQTLEFTLYYRVCRVLVIHHRISLEFGMNRRIGINRSNRLQRESVSCISGDPLNGFDCFSSSRIIQFE